jgi:phosphate transport system substrate-binding protein
VNQSEYATIPTGIEIMPWSLWSISQEVESMMKRLLRVALVLWVAFQWLAIANAQTQATTASQTKPQPNSNATAIPPAAASQNAAEHAALTHLVECIEPYLKQKELKGAAVLSGSTTMLALGKAWADRFRNFHPDVTFTRGIDGTEAAIKALSEDPTVIAGCSRPLTDSDLEILKKGKCKQPLSIIVALDPLALFVHKDNPVTGVTPEQIEAIFRAADSGKHAVTWGDLGVTQSEWSKKPIRIHSRSEISGTTNFIKQVILRSGTMAKEAQAHKSSEEICGAISNDPAGVGLCGFGEATPQIRAVPLILNGVAVPATEQTFLAGQYPFVRPLILVIDKSAMTNDGGLREAILRYILSRDGQLEAIRAGFYPLDPAFIRHQLDDICGPQLR